ncbi:C3a anaphylatoxin chemotactic receptor-like [Ranitomeya imitator]|uniref:C3a anaphylatoxin chemotactic receptor-like n=1 Tax=Ranitomeya imitator TaxID=111125 RepID=UPI0037E91F51
MELQNTTDDYDDYYNDDHYKISNYSFRVNVQNFEPIYEPDSDYSQDDAIDYRIPKMCIIWYSITLVLGVIGNGSVIWIIGFRKKTVNAVWFLNLAIADFITCISLPLRISEWVLYHEIYYDHFLCKTGITILFINMICSVYFMTVISIDRCVSIFCPIWTKLHRTPRLATIISLLIWMLSILISIPYIVFNHAFDFVSECFPKYVRVLGSYTQEKRDAMFLIKNICMFAFPFAIILLSCILIFLRLRKLKRFCKSRRPFHVTTTVIVCFFICWFPYNTWPLVKIGDEYRKLDMFLAEIFSCLAYFSSCLNPILYIFFFQDFKKNFLKSLPTMLEKVFNEKLDLDCEVSRTATINNTVNLGSSLL